MLPRHFDFRRCFFFFFFFLSPLLIAAMIRRHADMSVAATYQMAPSRLSIIFDYRFVIISLMPLDNVGRPSQYTHTARYVRRQSLCLIICLIR